MKKTLAKNTKIKSNKNELPTWNLKDFYQSIDDKKINEDFKIIEKECEIFCKKYQDKISKIDAKNLFKAIENYEQIYPQNYLLNCTQILKHSKADFVQM